MATQDMNLPGNGQPELNLLLPKGTLEQPLWKSLFQNIDEFLFPRKLPPLQLTSKPVPVKDIWGFYDHHRSGALGSTVVHILALAAIITISLVGRRVVQEIKKTEVVTLIAPDDIPALPPSKTQVGGGGGGGDRDKFQAPKGKLPKFAMEQITPPQIVVRNEQAVISPSWSIHSGVGTQAYTFIWGMVGENQVFDDMDHVATTELR